MTAILFAGPSLHGHADRLPPAIDCRPPAGAGDILRALADGATAIGLVDGVFGDSRAVWHKEIVLALSRGVPVLGAASMGALRAAECAPLGMVPVGGIAQEYLDGRRLADSDLAVLHGPAELGFCPLTLALVDAQDLIAAWCRDGHIPAATARQILAAAEGLHFTRRTWPDIFDRAGLPPALRRDLSSRIAAAGPGRKTRDALDLVARLAGLPPRPPPLDPVLTDHLAHLAAEIGLPLP
ncbi:MAG: TfuA-like protein [Paracoccaceae bacterium]